VQTASSGGGRARQACTERSCMAAWRSRLPTQGRAPWLLVWSIMGVAASGAVVRGANRAVAHDSVVTLRRQREFISR
jgi:hypothetical protein